MGLLELYLAVLESALLWVACCLGLCKLQPMAMRMQSTNSCWTAPGGQWYSSVCQASPRIQHNIGWHTY